MQLLSPRLLSAFEFAAVAHHKQYRKNPSHIPYISHPAAVAHILSGCGFSEDMIIAGLLHDVIEDTEYGAEDIQKLFGGEVLGLVLGVTEDKKLPWHERKAAYNEHLKTANAAVAALSAADLLANRGSLLLALREGKNPWLSFSEKPKEYSEKIKLIDSQRIAILKVILGELPLMIELEAAEAETLELTKKISW